MKLFRVARVVGPVLALLGLVTCGSSGSKSGTGGPGKCGPTGTGNGTCTSAETSAYSTCLNNACGAQYNTCFTGACSTTLQCQDKCACGNLSCLIDCGIPTAACTTCLASLETCAAACTVPACYAGGGLGGASGGLGGASGTGANCAQVLACCNRASAAVKPTCMATYTSLSQLGDSFCALSLPDIESSYCPAAGAGSGGAGGTGAGGVSGGPGGTSGGPGGAAGTGQACQDLLACCNVSTQKAACLQAYNATIAQGEAACAAGGGAFKLAYCPSSTGATCADLLGCCTRANASVKPTCMTAYNTATLSGDGTCGLYLELYMPSFCP